AGGGEQDGKQRAISERMRIDSRSKEPNVTSRDRPSAGAGSSELGNLLARAFPRLVERPPCGREPAPYVVRMVELRLAQAAERERVPLVERLGADLRRAPRAPLEHAERIALEVAGRGDRVLVLAEQVLHARQVFRIRRERGIRRGEELELVAKALRRDAQAMQALRGRVLDDLASEPSEPLDALAEPPRGELGERCEGRFPFVALDGCLERGERRPKLLEARPDEHVRRR